MRVAEILVGAEEVLQEGYVLGQQGAFTKRLRRVGGVGIAAIVPALRFKDVDDILPRHEIGEAAADGLAHFLLLMFRIQGDHGFPGFQQI